MIDWHVAYIFSSAVALSKTPLGSAVIALCDRVLRGKSRRHHHSESQFKGLGVARSCFLQVSQRCGSFKGLCGQSVEAVVGNEAERMHSVCVCVCFFKLNMYLKVTTTTMEPRKTKTAFPTVA